MTEGMHIRGCAGGHVCGGMHDGGMCGGACMQEIWLLRQAVYILLECILVASNVGLLHR